jgi:hypothetical protein
MTRDIIPSNRLRILLKNENKCLITDKEKSIN